MKTNVLSTSVFVNSVQTIPDRRPIMPKPWSPTWIAQKVLRPYNRGLHQLLTIRSHPAFFKEFDEVRERSRTLTDIDEHLETMFIEGLVARPKVIVELGVRGGASTFVFERVAELCHATLISADIEDCSSVSSSSRWHFFRGDDVRFAELFPEFCRQRGVMPIVDLLFIDTSHYYDHTVQEIASWFPLLSSRAKVMFHDTNCKNIGPRKDGLFSLGWDNQRGVIRAIEEYLDLHIDEERPCTAIAGKWLLRHWPHCNGFTILDRIA